MGRRGRAPEPTALKVLKGRPDHQKPNRFEPKPRPLIPACPRWLDLEAKREWRRMAPILFKLGLLTEADGAPLAAYCQAYATWRRATEAVREKGITSTAGNGGKIIRPEMQVAAKMMMLVKILSAEFGMTPSSRARMIVPGGEQHEEDEFSALLS